MLSTQRSFGAGGRDLQVVWTGNGARVVQDWSDHPADPLAVSDGDWLRPVDGDPQSPPRLARLLHCVELIAHVLERRLEQGFDRRYWPGRHVAVHLHYATRCGADWAGWCHPATQEGPFAPERLKLAT